MKSNLMAQCISCHQQHQTQTANVAMLDTVCTRCHDESSGAYKRGQQIKTLLVETQVEIDGAEALIDKAKLKGVDVTEDEVGLERAKSNLLEAIPTIHALNISLVEENTVQAKSISSDIKLRIHEILESFRLRKLALGVVWLFILFTATVLYIKKKRADREFDLRQGGQGT
jgi:predicted CXXCH cytochrome family protein